MKILPPPIGDLWLRISMALARLLLASRVPLPGVCDTGPFATFNGASLRETRHGHWRGGFRPVGGTA
ncbi:hypothetical protein OG612_29465 [Streptomyces sp. NBC_01527]|uniref:hypothetical protein n=1 Tax=Streptomyces sp. NBC_01527 TaxID=2903894 RepID=UPI00386FE1B3